MTTSSLLPLLVILISCAPKRTTTADVTPADSLKPVPPAVNEAIQHEFPGALPYATAIDSILARLARAGISSEDILWGQSTCVDDITNTKNKIVHPEIKGPFIFGGLAGLPFTGITGTVAFAHHVPHGGTAVLFLGPHIGYSTDDGWGKIHRHGQDHASTCCGALHAALDKLRQHTIHLATPSEEDYQEQTIEQLALAHQDEILSAKEPLVQFTRIVHSEAEKRMTYYASKVKSRDFAYGVVLVGVIINTDSAFNDYLWIDHFAIIDIENERWLNDLQDMKAETSSH
ncbi:hypothetical protein KK083_00960 [Fulvivirgaceae bacterium PWU4]|uniref:Limiting CO2-inducible protein B/C beta carbonyic anhydrase domain-containing protein n=1 Tax=Chryseosolibacter histidini TaxID=2782349 RepID=A0AAP2GGX9_9BACT|nr:hypothetical protein [Chryseosolibacter histidini]MBT1695424.1 hypothetical protein [Chryseosolibacter histidini]